MRSIVHKGKNENSLQSRWECKRSLHFKLNKIFKGSESLINTLFSSDYKVFGAFFYGKRKVEAVSPNTVKNRLKSLQIEYYSSR